MHKNVHRPEIFDKTLQDDAIVEMGWKEKSYENGCAARPRLYFKPDWIFVGLFCLRIMGFVTDRLLTYSGSNTLFRYGITKTAFSSRIK